MTDIDISAAADDVAALLRERRALQAADRLDALRRDQVPAVQDALDRYVFSRAQADIETLGQARVNAEADSTAVTSMLQRLRAASRPPRMPDTDETAALSQAQQHDVYASIVDVRGNLAAQDAMATQDRVILGLRQETRTTARRGQGDFDDRIVVLWRDAEGQGHVREFLQANTEPSAQYDGHAKTTPASPGFADVITRTKTEGEDVNADRVRDMGRLSEGTIEMRATTHPRLHHPAEFSLRPTPAAVASGANGVERDSNGDGWFDSRDTEGVQDLNNTFKIHRGGGRNTYSAGCQTVVDGEYDLFIETARGTDGQDRWQYVLTAVTSNPTRALDRADQMNPDDDPRHPQHRDHALQQEISVGLSGLGGRYAEHSDDYSLLLLLEAKAEGISRVDQVVESNAVGGRSAGETLFLVQGMPGDPAARRVSLNAMAVIETPPETSLHLLRQQAAEDIPSLQDRNEPVHQHNVQTMGGH